MGVTETDTNNLANVTNYEYTYDADGSVLTSRMAPGDLAQAAAPSVFAGLLTNTSTLDWNGSEPTPAPVYIHLDAGQHGGILTLDSPAFDAALVVQPPGGGPNSWIIDNNSGGGTNAYLLVPIAGETGVWTVWVTSPCPRRRRHL